MWEIMKIWGPHAETRNPVRLGSVAEHQHAQHTARKVTQSRVARVIILQRPGGLTPCSVSAPGSACDIGFFRAVDVCSAWGVNIHNFCG